MEIMIVVALAAPLLVAWVIFCLRKNHRFFWIPYIPGVAYITSGIALFSGSNWGGNSWFGHEITVLLLSTIVIWIGALGTFIWKSSGPPKPPQDSDLGRE